MRRILMTALAVTLVLAGCSSSGGPMAVDLSFPLGQIPEQPFTASGEAVDEGVVCSGGMWTAAHMETMEGEPLDFDGWSQLFDAAVAAGSVAEARQVNTFECDDGSGAVVLTDHVRLDFAEVDATTFGSGETRFGTWTLEGSGDYDAVRGAGDTMVWWDEGRFHFVGEIEG